MINYNIFHHKNVNIQKKLINSDNYTYQSLIKIISKYFSISKDKNENKVLDLGCGVGTIDFYLAEKGYSVIGVDISSRAISLARKSKKILNLPNVDFIESSVASFDSVVKYNYVIMSEVIEHLEDPKAVLKKIGTLMRDKGIVVISTPLDTAPLYKMGMLDVFDLSVGHLRRYSKDGLFKLLNDTGYDVDAYFITEGIFRNLLFTKKPFGFLLKFAKWPVSSLYNLIDSVVIRLFGGSNIYLICRKK